MAPGWTGSLSAGNDIAVVLLDAPVLAVQGYQLAQDTAQGASVVLAGYGLSGDGTQGSVAGTFGTLRYEWLAGWMGYKVFYDPTLVPLLLLSVVGVLGMAWNLGTTPGRRRRRLPGESNLPARENNALVAQGRSR